MKKIIALILLLACALSMASCAAIQVYDSIDLLVVLQNYGYETKDVEETLEEGIAGYIYGYNSETEDEIYYIYCDTLEMAKKVYDYISTAKAAEKAELEFEIAKIEYALYSSENVNAEEKGQYYENYVKRGEELKKLEDYKCGYKLNVVWYGTKQAIADIKKG